MINRQHKDLNNNNYGYVETEKLNVKQIYGRIGGKNFKNTRHEKYGIFIIIISTTISYHLVNNLFTEQLIYLRTTSFVPTIMYEENTYDTFIPQSTKRNNR